MERTFYHAFYKKTSSIRLSMMLSKLAYGVFMLSYRLNKLLHRMGQVIKGRQSKHQTLNFSLEAAAAKVQETSPKPKISFGTARSPSQEGMDLSIIVPVYNYALVLRSCLDSIINQETHYEYEIFLVDDGSTDGSSQIMDSYGELERVHILKQENKGISAARNYALEQAAGKFFMFVDCDDYLEKNAVEILLNKAYQEQCDIVEGGYYTFDNEKGTKRNYIQKPILLRQGESDNFDKLMNYTGYPWAKVYRRELFDGIGFPENSWFEDTLVKLILFRRCKSYVYAAQAVYGYRKYEGNYTETQVKSVRGLEHIWMLQWMMQLSDTLQIGTRESMYKALLYHLGALYLYRVEAVSEELQQSAFLLGGELLAKYEPKSRKEIRLPYIYKELEKAYKKRDFMMWKHVCRYM